MTPLRAIRWSMIVAPVLAGVALLIFGTAGGISTAFGITLIGIGPIIWMWNWFLRMAFDEEAGKQAAREQELRERDQPPQTHEPPPGSVRQAETERPPATALHEHRPVTASHEHQRPRMARRPRRRP